VVAQPSGGAARWAIEDVACRPCAQAATHEELEAVFGALVREGLKPEHVFKGQCDFARALKGDERRVFEELLRTSGLPVPCGG